MTASTIEALAYTWFNRLVAIRFMELHGYLDHGYRVLSHPEGKPTPELLEQAEHVDLPGLKRETVIDLKLAANKEGELFRMLLIAQCNALHAAMPFLFERIDDETELVLPDNLLHTDSLIRRLVREIGEEDWQEVEIIGWLYQFYISEKKDQVIGKVVKSEDIPAATQLFTPNWIVKYLVQNTLGRQWLATYPQSPLRQQMEYYIEPAEQTPEVQEQLKAITPTSLNPEELTLLDPACGSGHILVEAYDLFKAIYQERGYRAKDIPRLILEKNLFGLEIDDRAAQLAAVALMMKARADDRRIFDSGVQPNVLAFQESRGLDAADITHALNAPINKEDVPKEYLFEEIEEEQAGLYSKQALAEKGHVSQADIAHLLELFENAKTFGSLIQIPPKLAAKLPEIEKRLEDVLKHGDLSHASAHVLKPLLRHATLLARQYDAVVANPPYMGKKFFNPPLKSFAAHAYPASRSDLYSCFIERNLTLSHETGCVGLITIPNWMFLSTFKAVRERVCGSEMLTTFVHNGRGVFGSDFGSCAFTLHRTHINGYQGTYKRLFENTSDVATNSELEERFKTWPHFITCQDEFTKVPTTPLTYWVSERVRSAFVEGTPLGHLAEPRQGMATTDNTRFLRYWYEVAFAQIGFGCTNTQHAASLKCRWFPYNKGGAFRKWSGNMDYVVDYADDGRALKVEVKAKYRDRSYAEGFSDERWDRLIEVWVLKNQQFYFLPSVSWSKVSMGAFSARLFPAGFVFDVAGSSLFVESEFDRVLFCGLLNSKVARVLLSAISPTVNYEAEHISAIPVLKRLHDKGNPLNRQIYDNCLRLRGIASEDWNQHEVAWEFLRHPMVTPNRCVTGSAEEWYGKLSDAARETQHLEQQNNHNLLVLYGLDNEIDNVVSDHEVTLYRPKIEEDIKRLLSYAVGCVMGHYSLDEPGLIYAHSGNQDFDPSRYKTFRADEDGLVPLLETDWGFRDDATSRIVEFVSVAWPKEHLEENLKFIADSLVPSKGEQPRDTIRRYLATGFYKHHLSMYKRRPIYWLFSSGKQRAFQCLVYLHRYNEGTLARMRTEYVIPLQGQMAARIDQLEGDKTKATSTSHRNKLQKEQDGLKKQQAELLTFEEKLKHYADMRITLDLDDGVKVNYAKFGDLLAEVKAVTGGKGEE